MLPMLTVSGGPGLVYLNGRFCGETGAAAMPLASDGVQYLELRPFDPKSPGAVLRLSLEDGKLIDGVTGDVYAVQWPEGWIALELHGENPGLQAEPRLLATLDMPGGRYLLVNEEGCCSFGRNADEAVFLPVEEVVSGFARPHFFPGLCVIEGKARDGGYIAILKANDEPELVSFVIGENANLDAQGILRATESVGDLVGHALVTVYAPDARGNYALLSREPTWLSGEPRWPLTELDTKKAFLDALRIGAWAEAAGYLVRSGDLEEFERIIGEFDTVTSLPPGSSEGADWGVLRMDGPNFASVRRIGFSMFNKPSKQGNWKIDSITEGV